MTNYALQQQNQDMVSLLASQFRLLYNPTHAFADAVAMLQMFPGIRGAWTMGNRGGIGTSATINQVTDISGQERHLTSNNNVVTSIDSFYSYTGYDGATKYLSRASEANLNITGTEGHIASINKGLTLGGWFWFTNIANQYALIDKESSYILATNGTGNQAIFQIRDTVPSFPTITHSEILVASTWYFITGQFTATDGDLHIWVNGDKETQAGTSTAISTSANALNIGRRSSSGTLFFNGRASFCFLCAAAVPDIFINTFYQMTAPLFKTSI